MSQRWRKSLKQDSTRCEIIPAHFCIALLTWFELFLPPSELSFFVNACHNVQRLISKEFRKVWLRTVHKQSVVPRQALILRVALWVMTTAWFVALLDVSLLLLREFFKPYCLAALDFGTGVEQPSGCLIVRKCQTVQFMGRSMD